MSLILGKLEAVRNLLVLISVRNLLLEHLELVLHLGVNVPLCVRDDPTKRRVADLIAVIGIVDFHVRLSLGRPICKLDAAIAILDDLVAEQFLSSLLASGSHQPLLAIVSFAIGMEDEVVFQLGLGELEHFFIADTVHHCVVVLGAALGLLGLLPGWFGGVLRGALGLLS